MTRTSEVLRDIRLEVNASETTINGKKLVQSIELWRAGSIPQPKEM